MDLLTSPTSAYLLDAGLEVLHQQSSEWSEEIKYWRDEVYFFYSLIANRTLQSIPINEKGPLEKIEKEFKMITGGDLDDLQHAIEQHEVFLSNLLQSEKEDEESYRDKHKQLGVKIEQFSKRFRNLKKEVFDLVKRMNRNPK